MSEYKAYRLTIFLSVNNWMKSICAICPVSHCKKTVDHQSTLSQVQCVRLGVLLEAKLNLLCFEGWLAINLFFCSSTNSELKVFFCKTRNLLLKILDPPLALTQVLHLSFNMRTTNRHLCSSGERNGAQKRTKVSFGRPWCKHWSCYGWRKDTSRDMVRIPYLCSGCAFKPWVLPTRKPVHIHDVYTI